MRAAECQEDEQVWATVENLTPDIGSDAANLSDAKVALFALSDDRQSTVEHEKHFLLVKVAVDPSALPGPEPDDVQSEGRDAQLATKRLEAFARFEVES